VIHTYRVPDVIGSRAGRFARPALFPLLVIVALVSATIFTPARWAGDFTWSDAEGLGLGLVLMFVLYAYYRYRRCSEIRLSDDGTCELETKRRVIRLNVHEIRSVEYRRDSEDDSESYLVRYRGGKLHVPGRMADFHDFLARLKTLNPAVDLTSFPANAWPDLDTPITEERGTVAGRFTRTALFPVGVIAALAWLMYETFAGK